MPASSTVWRTYVILIVLIRSDARRAVDVEKHSHRHRAFGTSGGEARGGEGRGEENERRN